MAEVVAEQEREGPQPPKFVTEYGIRLEDDDHVRRLLSGGVRCMLWAGVNSGQDASVLDLLRLRKLGYASLPTDYEVHHEQRDGADYVMVREHIKNHDGSDLRGMPGYVDHLYLDDVQRDRFEHISSTPEDPDFNPMMLRELGDPVQFLLMHADAVCNGRQALPEVRAELMRNQRETPAAQQAHGGGAASVGSRPAVTEGPSNVSGASVPAVTRSSSEAPLDAQLRASEAPSAFSSTPPPSLPADQPAPISF